MGNGSTDCAMSMSAGTGVRHTNLGRVAVGFSSTEVVIGSMTYNTTQGAMTADGGFAACCGAV